MYNKFQPETGGFILGIYAIIISLLIIIGVPVFELIRKKERIIDYLSLINVIFFLAYGIVPIYIYLFPNEVIQWRTLLHNNTMDTKFFIGILIALLFYIITAISYYVSGRVSFVYKTRGYSEEIFGKVSTSSNLFKPAILLFIIGGASLLVYMNVVGGFSEYLRVGRILRNDGSYIQHSLMFLKNITPLICVSSFMFYSFIKSSRESTKFINMIFFLVSFIASLLVIFHSSGRMTVFIYLVTFPLANMLFQNRIKIRRLLLGSILFLILVIYGNSLLDVEAETIEMNRADAGIVNNIVREVGFPFVNIATMYDLFPSIFSFRGGFTDVTDALIGLVPSRIISLDTFNSESVSVFNTKFYSAPGGVMPVDIISFGYMSFGLAGVVIVAFLFGFLAKWTENLFSYHKSFVACMFYISLMIVFSFRLMYGDPVMILDATFRYIVAMIFILATLRIGKHTRTVE